MQIYSHTASTLYLSWAEMGTTGAPSAMVLCMKVSMASCWASAAASEIRSILFCSQVGGAGQQHMCRQPQLPHAWPQQQPQRGAPSECAGRWAGQTASSWVYAGLREGPKAGKQQIAGREGWQGKKRRGAPPWKHSTGTSKCLASGDLPDPTKQHAVLFESSKFAHNTPQSQRWGNPLLIGPARGEVVSRGICDTF